MFLFIFYTLILPKPVRQPTSPPALLVLLSFISLSGQSLKQLVTEENCPQAVGLGPAWQLGKTHYGHQQL